MKIHNCGASCDYRCYLVLVNLHTFLYGRGENAIIVLKILGATVANLVTWATRCPEFVQACCIANSNGSLLLVPLRSLQNFIGYSIVK